MSIKSQLSLLRQIHGASQMNGIMLDDHGYLNHLLGKIHQIAKKGINFAAKYQGTKDGLKIRIRLPIVVELEGHIPLKIRSYIDSGVEQFNYVYGEDVGVVNVLRVKNGKITKWDKTPLCEQLDQFFGWTPWSPTPALHFPDGDCSNLTGGLAER